MDLEAYGNTNKIRIGFNLTKLKSHHAFPGRGQEVLVVVRDDGLAVVPLPEPEGIDVTLQRLGQLLLPQDLQEGGLGVVVPLALLAQPLVLLV